MNRDVPGRFPPEPMRYVRGRLTTLRRHTAVSAVASWSASTRTIGRSSWDWYGASPLGGGARYAAFAGTAYGPRYEDP